MSCSEYPRKPWLYVSHLLRIIFHIVFSLEISPRNGRGFTFVQLIWAMVHVYNISYPLAFLLASVGFLTSAKLSFHSHHSGVLSKPATHFSFLFSPFIWMGSLLARIFQLPSWTLDLQSLSQRGCFKIAHDGSLVHPDGKPSTSPDPIGMESLLHQAAIARDSKGNLKGGLDFLDIVRIHTENTLSTAHPRLSRYHEQVSLGRWACYGRYCGVAQWVSPRKG